MINGPNVNGLNGQTTDEQHALPQDDGSKERLLRAAVDLFARRGYAATSVREIVAEAGVTKPVLYYYFGNKEGLLRSIVNLAAEAQASVLQDVLNHDGDFLERVSYFYQLVFEQLHMNRNLVRMINGLVLGPDQGSPAMPMLDFRRRMDDTLRSLYQAAADRGEIHSDDPEAVVHVLRAVMDSCIFLEMTDSWPEDGTDLPARMLNMIYNGLRSCGDEQS